MKRSIAALVISALVPVAHAQDKAKGEFTHGGEFRVRDNWMLDGAGTKGSTTNTISERFKLDLGFKASEKLSANLTLLHNFNFGRGRGQTLATPNGVPGQDSTGAASTYNADFMTVNQAYATWLVSDDFAVKVGRMNLQIADGALIGANDWEPIPYALEGLAGVYEAEFGRFTGLLLKGQEMANFAGVTAPDPEHNIYGLSFDLKTMPEVLKAVNVHVLKQTGDAATAQTGVDYLRYGLNVGLGFSIVDLKLWYEAHTGKDKPVAAASTDATGSMMQAELGARFENVMNSYLFFKYHSDSGDNTADTKNEAYSAFLHEKHCSAGCMDLFDWGNLTFMQVGWTGKPMDKTEVGLNYWMFSRTKKGAGSTAVQGSAFAAGDLAKDKLGDEIDLWASHKYDNGLTTTLRFGYFTPGDHFKGAPANLDKKPMQIFVEGRFAF